MTNDSFRLLRAQSEAIRRDCCEARDQAHRMVASSQQFNREAAERLGDAQESLRQAREMTHAITNGPPADRDNVDE